MKKNYLKSLKVFLTLLLLCGVSNAWGANYTELFTIKSADVVSKSDYQTYTRGVDKDLCNTSWIITFGGNNKSVGTNDKKRTSCNLNSYSKYAVSPVTTSDVASAFVCISSISDIAKISYTFNGGSNQTDTNVYLIYSSDGNTFSQLSLTSGTQGATISSGTTYEFSKCSGYFGLLFKATNTSGNWRIDDVNITFYKESDTPSKELVSIAISGTPDKTTYETGESFDITGLTVTGTYDIGDPKDLTADAEWEISPATFTSTTQNSVSVIAKVGEKSDTKNYNVTVTEHVVTPGTYDINLNNALWGTTYNGTFSLSANSLELNGTSDDVALNLKNGSSTNGYITDDQTRAYNGYSLKFTAPTGYNLTSVVFTQVSGKDWKGTLSADKGEMETDNKTWSGNSNDVTISFNGTCVIEKVTVTYVAPKFVSSIAVKNAPTKTTYYVGDDFDPAGLVITATYTDESDEDIAYTEDNKDAFSFSGFNSEAEATDQVITVTYAEKSATFKVNIESKRTLNSITVASNPSKMVYEVGEALDLTGLVVNGIFSKGDPEPVEYTANPADGTTLDAIGTTTVTLTSVDNTELTTSFDVTVNAIEGDRLTLAETGVTGSSYTAWSDKEGTSGAKYAGKSAGGNSAIQLNDTNPSGIVSTTSGGNITKVKVVWNTNTANGRELEVFGSNIAYTSSGDLYDSNKKGTSLGTIKYGTSTELEIDEKYAYVGVRSKSGAMYLTSITFVWKEEETYTRTVNTANIGTLCVPYAFEKPDYMTLYNIVGKDESKIYFEETEDAIVAGKPYLFRSTEGTITLTYTGEKATEAKSSNGLVGTFDGCTIIPNAYNYILSNNTLYYVNGDFTCGANRAYINIDGVSDYNPSAAKSDFTLDFNDPTGINTIDNGQLTIDNSKAYNLNGVRVNEAYKGIVIMNGKKYINK